MFIATRLPVLVTVCPRALSFDAKRLFQNLYRGVRSTAVVNWGPNHSGALRSTIFRNWDASNAMSH